MALLGEHLSAGRLDVHEYDERCARVAAARVQSDIVALFTDLPPPHPIPVSSASRPSMGGAGGTALVVGGVAAAMLLAVVAKQVWLVALLVLAGVLWFSRRRG